MAEKAMFPKFAGVGDKNTVFIRPRVTTKLSTRQSTLPLFDPIRFKFLLT
jgi:hypothetical protein